MSDVLTGRAVTEESRFWSQVNKTDGCWLWTGSQMGRGAKVGQGYGKFWWPIARKHIGAHRYVWLITNGEIPEGLQVCHHCDIPLCVNPAHLWLGTDADNQRDSRTKGRAFNLPSPSPETRAKISAANKGRKWSESQRLAIQRKSIGRKHTPESLAKMSVSQRGRIMSADSRTKMSAAKKGKPLSLEHRAKLSEAHKQYYAHLRQMKEEQNVGAVPASIS